MPFLAKKNLLDIIIVVCYIFNVSYKNKESRMKVREYSLRERKHAKTKIAIMNAFIKSLEKTRFDDISIRQICKSVEVSEGTFFNYFPEKIDIINYYMHLIILKDVWKAQREAPEGKYLAFINALFRKLAEELKSVNIIYQLVAILTVQQERPRKITITDLEKRLAFPDCPGIENIPSLFIDDFLKECLKGALKNKELPKNTDINDVLVSLLAILGGTLLAAKLGNIKDYTYHYMRQLKLLWKSLGAKA